MPRLFAAAGLAAAGLAATALAVLLLACAATPASARTLLNKAPECAECDKDCQAAGYSQYLNIAYYPDSCQTLVNTECGGCYLYRKYSQPATTGDFVSSSNDVSTSDHVLVMPRAGCAGVESWRTPACGYEYIWDAAWGLLTTGELKGQKAMAINPTHRRTQHQMHVHVADVDPALKSFMDGLQPDTAAWAGATCTGGKNLVCNPGGATITAQCRTVAHGDGPSSADPFALVYPSTDVQAIKYTTTLVYSPRKNEYCVLRAADRPAECLLKCTGDCQDKKEIHCP